MSTDNHIPPPLPKQPSNCASKAKDLIGSLASRGKAAGLLIAKQTERTRLLKVTLPGQYHALGKHLYGEGQYQEEFPSSFQAVDALLGQIKAVDSRSASEPKAEGIAAKAKAAAKVTQDMVQLRTLKTKLGHALTELGKAVYEKHGEQSGPDGFVRPIANIRTRVAVLDDEIGQLSQADSGQILTPKRIAVGGIAAVCVLLVLVVSGLLRGPHGKDNERKGDPFAKADKLWDAGQKAEAVDTYTAILYNAQGLRVKPEMMRHEPDRLARIYRRVIEFKIEQGGPEMAKDDIEHALEDNVSLTLSTREGNEFMAKMRSELAAKRETEAKSRSSARAVAGDARARARAIARDVGGDARSGAAQAKGDANTGDSTLPNAKYPPMALSKDDPGVNFATLDYSSVSGSTGPQGQPVEEKEESNATFKSVWHVYRGRDGEWHLHGRQLFYTITNAAIQGSPYWLLNEYNYVYGRSHGRNVVYHKNGVAALEIVYDKGMKVRTIARNEDGEVTLDQ